MILIFDVVIASPLPPGVFQVSNQACITATGLSPVLTNDPATAALGDPTVTALDVIKKLYLSLVAHPGAAEPVLITVVIENQGNLPARPFWVDLYINPAASRSSISPGTRRARSIRALASPGWSLAAWGLASGSHSPRW